MCSWSHSYQANSALAEGIIIISMAGYPHPIAGMKLRDMDEDMELGKVQMLPLIAIIACHHTAVVVTVPKIFRLHFLQLKSVTQKSYVALWSDCTFGGTQ